jgi:hypothetical protein
LAKRLSEKQKEEILRLFINGKTIEDLAIAFNCTKLTISRNLKKEIGEEKFKEYTSKIKLLNENLNERHEQELNFREQNDYEYYSKAQFMELTPLDYEIDNSAQKDLTSIPIKDVVFPKIVYIVVDKTIELEIKYLKDYPNWEFLSKDELNRKTIEIFTELKHAKRYCNKEQKVLKVPDSAVFQLVAPILLSRGISRIVSEEKLIAL